MWPRVERAALPAVVDTAMPEMTSTITGITRAPKPASFTSLAWIFFPRYSGVRPIIRPPMKTAIIAYMRMV